MSLPFETIETLLLAMCLLMVRMVVAFSLFPLFMGNAMPATVRISFVAGLSLCLLPMLGPKATLLHMEWGSLFPYLLKEMALGLLLGLTCSFIFWALHTAGALIEYQAGLNMAGTIDPLLGREESLTGGLFLQLLNMVFLSSGGLLALIGMLFESYRIWPIEKMLPIVGNVQLTSLIVTGITQMIELIIKIAAPFVILMLVAELSLGYLSRFAPQLNVFFLALPIKIVILAVLLLLFCVLLSDATVWLPNFTGLLHQLQQVLP